jgi:hypothetical protein
MKFILFLLALTFFSVTLKAQYTIMIIINNKKVAEDIIKPDQPKVLLKIKRSGLKKREPFIIKVYGEHIGGELYKRSLEITGSSGILIEETRNKPGHFDISKTGTVKQLAAGSILELYLVMNPSNPEMMFPSRRIYLGNLVMK